MGRKRVKPVKKIFDFIEDLFEFVFGFIAVMLILGYFGIDIPIVTDVYNFVMGLPIIEGVYNIIIGFLSILGSWAEAGLGVLILGIIILRRIFD